MFSNTVSDAMRISFSEWNRTMEVIDFFLFLFRFCVGCSDSFENPYTNNNKTHERTQREMSGNEYEMGILYTRAHFVAIRVHEMRNVCAATATFRR